jgi:hypothetical protein
MAKNLKSLDQEFEGENCRKLFLSVWIRLFFEENCCSFLQVKDPELKNGSIL